VNGKNFQLSQDVKEFIKYTRDFFKVQQFFNIRIKILIDMCKNIFKIKITSDSRLGFL